MSNYTRKAKRNKQKMLSIRKLHNRALVFWQKQLVCPYNHQECREPNCRGCKIYEEEQHE